MVLGIGVADLFYDHQTGQARQRLPRGPRVDLRKTASELQLHADLLWLRAHRIFEATHGLSPCEWTDEELNTAMEAVARAYADLERADFLEGVAFRLRFRELAKRKGETDAFRHRAA